MKYLIIYQCNSRGTINEGQFEIEKDSEPNPMDSDIVGLAIRDSAKYHQSGTGSVNIPSITPVIKKNL